MRKIDSLIYKAKDIVGKRDKSLTLAIITDLPDGRVKATAQLWDGKTVGDITNLEETFDTEDEARAYIDRIGTEYPSPEPVTLMRDGGLCDQDQGEGEGKTPTGLSFYTLEDHLRNRPKRA